MSEIKNKDILAAELARKEIKLSYGKDAQIRNHKDEFIDLFHVHLALLYEVKKTKK
jgi:hypothetical protein